MSTKIICGDSAEVLQSIDAESVDLVVTSPPYDNLRAYKGFNFDFEAIARELYRVLKSGGVIVWVVGDATIDGSESGNSFRQALAFQALGLNIHDTMIYQKAKVPPLSHKRYEQGFEYMFIFSKGKPSTFNGLREKSIYAGKVRKSSTTKSSDNAFRARVETTIVNATRLKTNVWKYANGLANQNLKHPAMFPLALAIDQISSWSNEGDVVLDPFLGSGTTGLAAKKLARNFIGIEIAKEYANAAKERIEAHQ